MRIALVSCLAVALAGLSGCGERAPGIIITGDGRMLDNSAENNRVEAVRTIDSELQKPLGEHWRAVTTIAELPTWNDERSDGDWQWQKATVTVALIGDGTAPLPISTDEVHDGVFKYLRGKVDRAKANLAVTVTQRIDTAAFARATPPPDQAQPVPPLAVAGPRTYTVQTGDTLADISSAFYGSPQYWRRIVDANPGLDPGQLKPGAVLTIPPAPSAGGAATP